MRIVLLIILMYNAIVYAQQDSSAFVQKWEKTHCIGVEFGTKLHFYDLFYQYQISKNKHSIGFEIGGNYLPNYGIKNDQIFGIIVGLNYYYKLTQRLDLSMKISESFLNNYNTIKGDYDETVWYDKPFKHIENTGITTGINFNFKSINYFIDVGLSRNQYKIEGVGLTTYVTESYLYPAINFGTYFKL